MAKTRRRAPGGGRKSKGEFSQLVSALTIRMPADMRKQLDLAAHASGRSVTQELLGRVRSSFYRDREKAPEPAIRALCFLISQLANDVIGYWDAEGRARYNWRSNRFFFRAFKKAVADVFDAIEPGGNVQGPSIKEISKLTVDGILPEYVQSFGSPEKRGKYALKMRWHQLLHSDPNANIDFLDTMPGGSSLKAELERESYGMADVRRDLQLKL